MKFEFGRTVPPHERLRVPWYQPDVLFTAAREVLSSLDQLRNLDLRQTYRLPLTVIDRSGLPEGEDFWFDFIADTGDGGNATYAVAHAALAADVPGAAGEKLPRGELLLFGGDLAYPGASPDDYRYRFVEMYEGARPDAESKSKVRGRPFTVAALAQNHDWMDSASTFNRYFVRNKDSVQFLGAEIPQEQSYFCVKLAHGWWVFGFDFALTHDIDRDQFEQFAKLASKDGLTTTTAGVTTTHRIGADDKIIMIYPEPYWTRPILDGAEPSLPRRYQRLEGLFESRIRMRLAGDLHHYMRWTSADHGLLVTCGTGGAFTHPTHTRSTTRQVVHRKMDTSASIPKEAADQAVAIGLNDGAGDAWASAFVRDEASVYPAAAQSRRLVWGNIRALFRKDGPRREGDFLAPGNWQFALLLGLLYWFNAYLNSTPFIESFEPDHFKPLWKYEFNQYGEVLFLWLKAMIFSPLGFVINAAMLFACIVMGREAIHELPPSSGVIARGFMTFGIGFLHALVHIAAIFSLEFGLQQLVGRIDFLGIGQLAADAPPYAAIAHAVIVGAGMIVLGGILGALIFGLYLSLMSRFGFLTNNGYSALGIEDFKGFLRFKLACDGTMTAHFIAIRQVPKRWERTDADGANVSQPVWEAPLGEPLEPRLHDSFPL